MFFSEEQMREEMDDAWNRHFGATELQNAYTISQQERKPDDTPRINAATEAGFHVLVLEIVEYCPRTDAALPGVRRVLVMADRDRNKVYKKYNECEGDEDHDYIILPKEKSPLTFGAVLQHKQEDPPF